MSRGWIFVNRGWIFALALLALGCASSPRAPSGAEPTPFDSGRAYTLVNLHPDNERSRLFAVNYQQRGLVPVCSEVEFLGLSRETLRFRVVSTGREYEYFHHKAAAEPFPDHLARFFGPSCPREEIEGLSEVDRRGIHEGRAIEGMTRRGVILAMGPPPRHVNPDPNAPSFLYWKNRFNRVEVKFGLDGRVSAIRE